MLKGNMRLRLRHIQILVGQCQGILDRDKVDVGMVTHMLNASVRSQHWAGTQTGLR